MAGYSRARSAAAFCLSLAVHAAIFGGSWYIYKTGRAEPVIVENVLGWESLEYLTEEEHAPAPPPPPPPPPGTTARSRTTAASARARTGAGTRTRRRRKSRAGRSQKRTAASAEKRKTQTEKRKTERKTQAERKAQTQRAAQTRTAPRRTRTSNPRASADYPAAASGQYRAACDQPLRTNTECQCCQQWPGEWRYPRRRTKRSQNHRKKLQRRIAGPHRQHRTKTQRAHPRTRHRSGCLRHPGQRPVHQHPHRTKLRRTAH